MPEEIEKLSEAILQLLEKRAPGKSICPSEAARLAYPDSWRQAMEQTREAARRLASQDQVEICQSGERIDPESTRGPIRIRKTPTERTERKGTES